MERGGELHLCNQWQRVRTNLHIMHLYLALYIHIHDMLDAGLKVQNWNDYDFVEYSIACFQIHLYMC